MKGYVRHFKNKPKKEQPPTPHPTPPKKQKNKQTPPTNNPHEPMASYAKILDWQALYIAKLYCTPCSVYYVSVCFWDPSHCD